MITLIALNYRDARPIYIQIEEGLRKLILTGVIATGDQLPSVRELATQMAINPNTIQRAYRELEAEGFIHTIPGRGSFAAALAEVDNGRKEGVLKTFQTAAVELLGLGIEKATLKQLIDELKEEGVAQ
ncbi:MAG: GntR family transcriptional regulator [Oscillospiraceae bacterium]